MSLLAKHNSGCPPLFLAPMEGVGDRPFRKAMAAVGGFDHATTEFLRVPINAHVESLARVYQSNEIAPFPLAAQIMGSDPLLMGAMAKELEKRGAKRIDLNCGCPSNTVTGKGAGSSLLKIPDTLHEIARTMVNSVSIPVTLKMRSGYEDTSLFKENLHAAESSGVKFITLHPRTKVDGYGPKAKWELIAEAKSRLKIPLIGNGDILTVQDALLMLSQTNCDALMIGRGAVSNPFIFQEIKAHFKGTQFIPTRELWSAFFDTFRSELIGPERSKINKFKQILSFVFKSSPHKTRVMTTQAKTLDEYLSLVPIYDLLGF